MRQETALFKDKIEVSLDGRQVFYLFFGGAVIASLVFILGVMVGKRVEARSHGPGAPIASAASDPLAALDQLGTRDHKSFRSALIDGGDNPRFDVDVALAAKAEPVAADKPTAGKPPAAKIPAVKPANKPPAAKPAAAKPVNKPPAAKPAAGKPPAAKPAAAKPPAAKPADKPGDKPTAKPDAGPKPVAKWTLQLSSFQDRVEADSFYDKLKAAGYSPYVVEADVPGKGLYYRVRLGHYRSYDTALAAKKEFEDSQGVIAYVTRLKNKSSANRSSGEEVVGSRP